MKDEIDCWNTDFPICPHCGFEDQESYTDMIDPDIYTCDNCDKDFRCEGEMNVSFFTSKVKE